MPEIRPSSDLRNKYADISNFCHENDEPVYITKNGKGDLAVLSIEAYEKLVGRFELEILLSKGEKDIESGKTYPLNEALKEIESRLNIENL